MSEGDKKHMTKKKALLIGVGLVLMVAIIVSISIVPYALKYNQGVITKISLNQKNEDTMVLRMTYLLPSGAYSIRTVPEDEGEYVGDGMIDYDGSLGKYRIMVNFGEVELAESFVKKRTKTVFFYLRTVFMQRQPVHRITVSCFI